MHRLTARALVVLLLLLLATSGLRVHRGRAQAPASETLVFAPAADTYVDAGHQGTNYDTDTRLRADSSPVRVSYLRFAVTGVDGRAVEQARLRLGVFGGADSGGSVHSVSDNSWDATTLNYHTQPAVDGPALQTLGPIAAGDVVEFDLGTAITGDGIYSFAIDTASTNGLDYNSSAATSGQLPQLLLTVPQTGPAPTVTILQPPDASSFFIGDPVTLQANATDAADGDLSASVAWRSDLQGSLGTGGSISPSLVEGAHTITASATNHYALTTTASLHLSVAPHPHVNTEPLVAITAPLDRQSFTVGSPIQFNAVANDLEDGPLTTGLAWTSDRDGAIGTGGSFARTLTTGTHRITAQVADAQGLPGTASVTVVVMPPIATELTPVADAYVDAGSPTSNFGTSPLIRADMNTERDSYLRFVVAGLGRQAVTKAILRLQVDSGASAPSDKGGTLYRVTDNAWGESTLTFNTKPPVSGAPLATVATAVKANQVVDFDVTAAITGDGTYNFALTSPSTDGVDYSSREGTAPPRLILTLAGSAPLVAIVAPPNQSVFFAHQAVGFTASATDPEDGDLGDQLAWSSSLDGPIGTGKHISASSLSVGSHTISTGVVDADGHAGEAQLSIRVRQPNTAPQLTITAPASGGSAPAGTPVTLVATVTDDFDTNLGGAVRWTSSRGGVLGTGASLTRTLSEGTHTLTATVADSDGASTSASIPFTVTPTTPAVTITAPVAGAAFFQNAGVAFTATASDVTDGNLAAQIHWRSSVDGPLGTGASITPSGLSVGPHVITAAVTNASGLTGEATRSVTVRPANVPPVVTILSPTDGTALLSGKPVLLSATATDAEDGNLGTAVRWTSSLSGALGTGATLTLPSLAVGTHALTATVTDRDGTTVSASVHVTIGASALSFTAVADTYVDSGKPTTVFGTAAGLQASSSPLRQAYLRFAVTGVGGFAVDKAVLRLTVATKSADASKVGGTIQSLSSSAWSEATTTYNTRPAVTGPALATLTTAVKKSQVVDFDVTAAIAADGNYDFALVSSSTDYVQYQSREGSKKPMLLLTLKQNTAPVVTVTAPAPGTVSSPGTPVTFIGTAVDAESGDLSAKIAWSSDLDGPLGTGASLTVTSLSPGVHTVTARVTDASGATATAQTTVTTDHPPVITITAPAAQAIVFTTAKPFAFTATATDAEDGDLTAQLQWTSSLDGPLGTGGSFSHDLRVGTHTITASVADAAGISRQAQTTIRVREPNTAPHLTITAPANGGSAPAGTPVTLAATVTDDFDATLAAAVRWTSSRDGTLGTGSPLTRTLSEGSHTLTATVTDSDGASATASIPFTVTPTPPVIAITAPTAGTSFFQNTGVAFTATATDATDGDLSAGIRWSSSVGGPLGTGASITPASLAIGPHVITATVTDAGGLSASATLNVTVRPPNVPPVLTIVAPGEGATFISGKPVTLTATATDVEDGNLGAAVRWSSSLSGTLGTGGTLTVSSLAAGSHTLTAAVTDHDGTTTSASVHVVVGPSSLSFNAVADTYVDSGTPTKVFGTAAGLQADSSPVREAYLRFAVTGVGGFAVDHAILRLTVATASADASKFGGSVRALSDSTWSEATTTYNNRPAATGAVLATHTAAVKAKEVVDFDVTAGMGADGVYNFALTSTNSDVVQYQSREGSTKPVLLLILKPNTAPSVAITVPATGTVSNPGAAVTFTGTAMDAESGDLGAAIAWSSSLDGPLGTGASLTVPSLSAGTHTVIARVTDPSGATAQAQTTVIVNNPPVVTITWPVDHTTLFTPDKPFHFTATATDVESGDLRALLQWTSSLDGPLGTGGSFTHDLQIGTHTITASVTDDAGITRQAQVTVRVRASNVPPTLQITSPAAVSSLAAGTPLMLAGRSTDDFDGDLSSRIVWSSSLDGPLGAGASVPVTLHNEGTHTLTAAITDSDDATTTATVMLTITPTAPVVTITSPATGALVFKNLGATFTGTALDATDGDISSRLVWTSNLDGQIGTGPTFSTTLLGVGTHVVTAVAKDNGNLTGQAQQTVVVKPANTFPVVQILSPTDGTGLFVGKPLVLDGVATDAEDGLESGLIDWSSSIDGFFGRGRTLTVTTLSPGMHTITAKVTDLSGAPSSTSVIVVVTTRSITLSPVADTTVDAANPTTTFGTSPTLAALGSPVKQSYLRFVVTGIAPPFTVQSAHLQLTTDSVSAAASVAGGTLQTIVAGNLGWSEAATTYATRPAIDGPTLATKGSVLAGQLVDFDVTSAVTASGTISFALTSISTDEVIYQSREAESGTPQLVINLHDPNDPTVTINAPSVGSVVSTATAVTFTGTAHDSHGASLSSSIQWSSNIDGFLGTGASITRPLNSGTHTIAASVTDANQATGSATVVITAVVPTPNDGLGVRDWAFGAGVEDGASNEATAQKPEAKLWYVDGLWWATLYNPTAGGHHIYKFSRSANLWTDTGVLVDERAASRQDVLWDGSKLYMVSRFAGVPAQVRLLRYKYTSSTKTWSMDSGFPINISGGATESMTIAKDSTGTLWIAYTLGNQVWVNHTLGSDTSWDQPLLLPFAEGNVKDDDIAGVQAMNGKIGVFFSNQLLKKDFFAVHVDGTDPASWTLETAGSGGKFADDHFNMKFADDGRLFVMIKTSYGNPGEILDGLLVRSKTGTWSPLFNIALVDFNPTRELILLDEVKRKIFAFYSLDHASLYYKVSDMDTVGFPDGPGTPIITSPTVTDISNPASTKQSITETTGILVEASSRADNSYWHNFFYPTASTTGSQPTVTISAPASGTEVIAGQSTTFTASATDPTDGNLSSTIQWTSNLSGPLGSGGSITRTLGVGTHTITASVRNSSGTGASATVTVTVTAGTSSGSAGYHLIRTITLGSNKGWDLMAFDPTTRRLFISRETHVMVLGVDSGSLVGDILNTSGVHGIALAPDLNRGFTSNGTANTVTIFDLTTLATLGTVPTGTKPDSITYEPVNHVVFAMNANSNNATAIDAATGTVLATIPLGGKPELSVADEAGHVYVNLTDKNQTVQLDGATLQATATWGLGSCVGPTGLAMDTTHRRLFANCDSGVMVVLNADTGAVVTTLPIGAGADGAGFDPGTGFAFAPNGDDGTLTIVHEDSVDAYSVVQTVTTQSGAGTMALDPTTHQVFVDTADPNVSGSFAVLVFGP